MKPIYSIIISAAALLVFTPSIASAYIDTSSAAMLVQLLIGGIAGLIVFLKLQGRRFLSFFKRNPQDKESEG